MLDNNIQNTVSAPTESMTTHLSRIKQEGAQVASLAESAASNTTSIAAQSALTGESFTDSLKSQYQNIVIGALANVAAKEIGSNYKNSGKTTTDRTIQLASHAALGCASASAAGGDCASGAVAGVVGELAAEAYADYAANKEYNRDGEVSAADLNRIKQEGVQVASLAGGYSTILTSGLSGDNHSQIAENIYIGSRVGRNAGENNAYFALRPLQDTSWLGKLSNNKVSDKLNIEIAHEQLFFEDEKGGNLGFFDDNRVRADEDKFLSQYVKTKTDFDDKLMREAIQNVTPKEYKLLDMKNFCSGKYNCQDWAQDVREEYYKLETNQNLILWNSMVNQHKNQIHINVK